MKINDKFGIICGNKIELYCVAESINDGVINFYVINGNWYGMLYPTGLIQVYWSNYVEIVSEHKNCYVGYEGFIPNGDYNEAIDYMNKQISSDWISNIKTQFKRKVNLLHYVYRKIIKIYPAIQEGCRSARLYYKVGKVKIVNDLDDEIPF